MSELDNSPQKNKEITIGLVINIVTPLLILTGLNIISQGIDKDLNFHSINLEKIAPGTVIVIASLLAYSLNRRLNEQVDPWGPGCFFMITNLLVTLAFAHGLLAKESVPIIASVAIVVLEIVALMLYVYDEA